MLSRPFRKAKRILVLTSCAAACGFLASPGARAETTDEFDTPHSLVGSYLAGRFARSDNESGLAAGFYRNALTLDPGNDQLLEQAFLMEATQGNWAEAEKLAAGLAAIQPQHRVARLYLGLSAYKSGDFAKAEEQFKAASTGPIGELTSALALAWVKLSEKDTRAALDLLEVPKQAEWAQFYLRYHRALVADIAGRKADARAAYDKVFKQDGRTLRTALAYARHAAHSGDTKLARTVLKEHLDKAQGDGHPLARALRDEIQSGANIDLLVSTPQEGLAEVFYGLGEALIGEGAVSVGILYLQMALFTEPNHPFALAALANALEASKQYAEAIEVYDRIPKGTPLESAIEIRKAFNLNSLDRVDEARGVLTGLLDADQTGGAAATSGGTPAAKAADAAPAREVSDIGSTILKVGSEGEKVRDIQGALAVQGFDIGGAVDGRFGAATRKAVLAFQRRNGIDADGLVGNAIYAAIVKGSPSGGSTDAASGSDAPGAKSKLSSAEKLQVLDALGNILRSRKMYAEAVEQYNRAIALITKPEKRHWAFYYARGTSYERLKNWPPAETDLKMALELYPDQPLTLNYLGYSWVDQGKNLDEGMAMIERAVAIKPDDGYVVDSLGWAHYKRGNFKEAVRYLERAVELRPDDPVLNDHLGDAYWRVGREREARFQWDQALSLKPDPEDTEKIRRKLADGLVDAIDPVAVTKKTNEVRASSPAEAAP